MSRARIRITIAALSVFLSTTAALVNAPAQSSWKRIIVKCDPEDLDRVRALVGGAIVDAGHGHFLITVPSSTDVKTIEEISGKSVIEADDDGPVLIQRRASRQGASTTAPALGALINYYGTKVRQGYTDQLAVDKIKLKQALNIANGAGVRIAIIDTGVDDRHSGLKSVIFGGRNYVGRTAAPSEFDDPTLDQAEVGFLDQAEVGFLDQSEVGFLDQAEVGFLDQAEVGFLDQVRRLPSAFGHGTMMAGLVHLVAPTARIMPFKAFDASGSATEWNVIRSIYDAVDMDADVISMSFSSAKANKLIHAAIRFAASRGVVLVGSAGNENTDSPTYPASLDEVLGISALDLNDQKASFSNFGGYVDLSAPGVGLITTYPGGHWVIANGTSDAAPLVSGVLGLVMQRGSTRADARKRVEDGADALNVPGLYRGGLGKGRLNAYNAVFRNGTGAN